MSECEKYIEMISELVDGELTQQQEAELRTHIDMCADCARVYEAFSGISDAIADELVMPPETLAKGIMYKIKVQNKSGAGKRFAFGRFTAFAACLARQLSKRVPSLSCRSVCFKMEAIKHGLASTAKVTALIPDGYCVPQKDVHPPLVDQ